jgi:uroporphyrinogen decarboxylase
MNAITDNTLRAIRFERPAHIPMVFWINPACWHHYPPEAVLELMNTHPLLFPDRRPGSVAIPPLDPWERAGVPYTDDWGCLWQTTDDGITGAVTQHPLADWEALTRFVPPDPDSSNGMSAVDWAGMAAEARDIRSRGEHCAGSLEHGHAFLRLTYLRGYENLLFDMMDAEPRRGSPNAMDGVGGPLDRLIDMVARFSEGIVRRYLDLGVAMMCYPEDLGAQHGPMLSPALFRRFIRPIYERLTAPARQAGCLVHMHSDGNIRDLADDLLAAGVDALNLQDLVNGVDWIAAHLKGRVCIDLDVDRQAVTRFGTPDQIDALLRTEVQTLGSREGGLTMIYGLYPGTPIENAKAVMDAMERYAGFYA